MRAIYIRPNYLGAFVIELRSVGYLLAFKALFSLVHVAFTSVHPYKSASSDLCTGVQQMIGPHLHLSVAAEVSTSPTSR